MSGAFPRREMTARSGKQGAEERTLRGLVLETEPAAVAHPLMQSECHRSDGRPCSTN